MASLTMSDKDLLLSIRHLRVAFRSSQGCYTEVVKNINFNIFNNRTYALVGESGSGKSVTALAIMGLLPSPPITSIAPESEINFNRRHLLTLSTAEYRSIRGKDIAMIFQEPMSSLNPVFTVGEQVAEPLRLHLGLSGSACSQRVLELLAEVGLSHPVDLAKAYPYQLSGGQQQRVMIAMAIACQPKLLIADEPTTALDVTTQHQILQLIAQLQRAKGMSVLMITHDLALASAWADSVLVMRNGVVCEAGPIKEVFSHPRHPYTRALLACRPRLDHRCQRLPTVEDFLVTQNKECESNSTVLPSPVPLSDGVPLLRVEHLSKSFYRSDSLFDRQVVNVVKDVSFCLARGKTIGLVGESGAGKTTVGLMLMRLCPASAGQVWFQGTEILHLPRRAFAHYKQRIQIIFQNPYASLNPRFTVAKILCEPLLIHGIGRNETERLAIVRGLLDKVGLSNTSLGKFPHQFSGGQRQRIAIARALAVKPEILICDEAVSALDVSVQAQVLNLLKDLQAEYQLSYLFISHDLAVVKHMSDWVIVMRGGEVVEQANAEQIYLHPTHPYTQQLLQAIPRIKIG